MSIDPKTAVIIIEAGEVVRVECRCPTCRDGIEVHIPWSPGMGSWRDEPITVSVDWGKAGGEYTVHMRPLSAAALSDAWAQAFDFDRAFANVRELLDDDERRDDFVSEVAGTIRRRIKGGSDESR